MNRIDFTQLAGVSGIGVLSFFTMEFLFKILLKFKELQN